MNRRQALTQGTCAVLAAVLGTAKCLAAAREQTSIIARSVIPVRSASKPLQFDLFFDLSRFTTANATLDISVAELHFEHFRREQWGWVTAARLYAIINNELRAGLGSVPELLAANKLPQLEQWYAQHLFDAWYEGFYRYDGTEIRVTFADALMWKSVENTLPVLGHSDRDYGFWVEHPDPGNNK